jgi:hypothetical protein
MNDENKCERCGALDMLFRIPADPPYWLCEGCLGARISSPIKAQEELREFKSNGGKPS